MGRDLPCIGRGLSIGNKYTNSPRIDGVEPKTKTASTEELPCASGGSKVVCICHSNPCICGENPQKRGEFLMDRAYVRLPAELGKVVEISAVAASKRKLNLLPYICPECTERLYLIQAGNGFFRNPFFRHRKKKECIVQECSERVYASPGIMSPTQKEHPRTPIFLYKKKEGSFALAVALTGKIKKKLAKQQYRQFVEYQMLCGNEIKAQAPISILLNSPQADFVDLHNTVPKKAQFASYLRKENGETRSLEEFLGLSPKLLDTFASSSCSGAMFRIVASGVYEKLPTGSFITSKQKYIILDKITNPTKRLNNNFEAYNVKVQELGLAKVNYSATSYRASCFNHRCLAIRNVLPSLTQCPQALGWASS